MQQAAPPCAARQPEPPDGVSGAAVSMSGGHGSCLAAKQVARTVQDRSPVMPGQPGRTASLVPFAVMARQNGGSCGQHGQQSEQTPCGRHSQKNGYRSAGCDTATAQAGSGHRCVLCGTNRERTSRKACTRPPSGQPCLSAQDGLWQTLFNRAAPEHLPVCGCKAAPASAARPHTKQRPQQPAVEEAGNTRGHGNTDGP